MQIVYFLVDTGADNTTISKQTLLGLGYDMDWIRQKTIPLKESDKPKTAVGETVNAGFVQLPLINILGYEGKNWAFQIVIDENQDFANLLGRDLLTGFNYTFDNDEDVFKIARAKAFKPRSEFLVVIAARIVRNSQYFLPCYQNCHFRLMTAGTLHPLPARQLPFVFNAEKELLSENVTDAPLSFIYVPDSPLHTEIVRTNAKTRTKAIIIFIVPSLSENSLIAERFVAVP
jgi:hypothetical protein